MTPETVVNCGACGHPFDAHRGNLCDGDGSDRFCSCWEFVKPEDATPVQRCNLLFPRHWNAVFSLKDPFVPGGPCHVDACEAPASGRVLVNIWGSVCEYEVCVEHQSWNGKMVDDFPCRKQDPVGAGSSGCLGSGGGS